ncbi:MAG TPA: VOC family protein [Stellaceae bacterium]|nr:VOC family protein [Stellaceae bacterium]
MPEQPQPQPTRAMMPEEVDGWRQINAGPHLHVMFHPNRLPAGRDPDGIERPSIVIAVSGNREQALRFDPFSEGSHYHIRPTLRGRQIPLWVEEGRRPIDVALAFFDKPLRFRGLLAQAEEDEVAARLDDADLARAARQIRTCYAAAHATADKRPPVAVGHVRIGVTDVGIAARWLEAVGLRPIVTRDELAVLELRGGTHVVARKTEQPPAPGTAAPFDLMVDDVDAAHRDYAAKGLSPSPISRGRIHDSFMVAGPDGWAFTVNSSHASDQPV